MVIGLTGHRPEKFVSQRTNLKWAEINVGTAIAGRLSQLKCYKSTPIAAISGMALGFDQWGAQECVDLKIPFIAAIPFIGFSDNWNHEDKIKYEELLNKASLVRVINQDLYMGPWQYQKRNEYIVDNCDLLIACYDGESSGGTLNTINYAKKVGKPIEFLQWKY